MLSLTFKPLHLLLLVMFTAPSAGSAEAAPVQPCVRDYQQNWLKAKRHKAVATTAGKPLSARKIRCGFSYGAKSREIAVKRALSICERGFLAPRCKIIRLR